MTPRPVIFVSAVSRELKTARQLVANTLTFLGYEPAWQDIFGTEQGDLREMLRRQIDACQGVVQLVGHRYGAEPPVADEHFGRVSYTQYEALYALQQGKKVWYLVMDENFPIDTQEPEPAELRELQAAYLRRLQTDSLLYHPLTNPQALETSVLKLRDDLTRLRRGIKQWAAAVIVLLLILVAAVVWIKNDQRKTTRQLNEVNGQLAELIKDKTPPPSKPETWLKAAPSSVAGAHYDSPAYTQSQMQPKAGEPFHPKIAFAVFGLSQDATHWTPLGAESSLRNGEHFFIRAETFTPGFLYVFEVDSSGQLQWLFPSNQASAFSSGANPIPAGVAVQLPPGGTDAYALDDKIGEERVYAIYSATRWEKLEAALENTSGKTNNAAQLEIATLLAADNALDERAKGIARVENTAVAKEVRQAANPAGQPLLLDLPPESAEAREDWLLQVRRFRHLAPVATHP